MGGIQDIGAELVNGGKLCELDYADDFVCLFEFTEHVQRALDREGEDCRVHSVCVLLPYTPKLLHEWTTLVLNLTLDGEELMTVGRLTDLGGF